MFKFENHPFLGKIYEFFLRFNNEFTRYKCLRSAIEVYAIVKKLYKATYLGYLKKEIARKLEEFLDKQGLPELKIFQVSGKDEEPMTSIVDTSVVDEERYAEGFTEFTNNSEVENEFFDELHPRDSGDNASEKYWSCNISIGYDLYDTDTISICHGAFLFKSEIASFMEKYVNLCELVEGDLNLFVNIRYMMSHEEEEQMGEKRKQIAEELEI